VVLRTGAEQQKTKDISRIRK